jgi:type VI secretion system protein ImpL
MQKKQNAVVLGALVFVLLLAWFVPAWLKLKSPDIWFVRGGLAIVGLCGVGVYWIVASRKAARQQAVAQPGGAADEVDMLVAESNRRLAQSGLGKGVEIGTLPAILFFGGQGSAKTSTILSSGLEPELMAGQSMQDGVVAPTRAVNFWLARRTVLVDLGGAASLDRSVREKLIRRLRPKSSMFGKGEQAPRAALVCVDAESFLRSGAAESTVNSARAIREALGEIAAEWGINLPVYVVFTRLDRVPFFLEYVNTFTNEEAGLVLGSTLSMQDTASTGVYAEQEAQRITAAFQDLVYSLADKRTEYLARENDAGKLAPAYQFPRELRKLRTLVTQYLVELGRPSQLRTNPFLRGFFFNGVRPIIVSDVVSARHRPEQQEPLLTDATGIFRPGASMSHEAAPQPTGRKVPQWVFLSHIFPDVVLRDGAALGSSSASLKTDALRRLLFLAIGAVGLLLGVAWIVSYGNNRALVNGTRETAAAVPTAAVLEALRVWVQELRDHHVDGAPLSYRWGLYAGSGLYPAATNVYFGHFRRLLLQQTQGSLLQLISQPTTQSLGYRPVYDALKAYLITTSHPDKSTKEFLPPALMEHWLKGRTLDPHHAELARRQFVFYAEQLPLGNPYPSFARPNDAAVATARRYLGQFAGTETIYAAMIAAASQNFPSINFNQLYPGSAEAVRNSFTVSGAFTKGGWGFMQKAIANPDQFFSGEKWVMGDVQVDTNIDRAKVIAELKDRYQDEFVQKWRAYLQATTVVPFALGDAPSKLAKLTDIVSPLLGVLCVASQNTSVDDKDVAEVFQPAQHVTPEGCQDKLSAGSNASYMEKLTMLKASIDSVVGSPNNDSLKTEAINAATQASVASQLVAQQFRIDKEAQQPVHATVKKILDDPIVYAQRAIGDIALGPFNAAGAGLCSQWRALTSRYPFNPKATQEATMADVAALFAPNTGEVAKLAALTAKLPDGVQLNPAFRSFLRDAVAVSDAFYKGGSATPNLTFALRPGPAEGIRQITLNIHGQTLRTTGGGAPMRFSWPGGGAQQVQLAVNIGSDLNYPSYSGQWALFRFFGDAERSSGGGSEFSLEWTLRTSGGVVTTPSGKPVTVRFDLDMLGAPPILRPGYLASLNCVPTVVRAGAR